MTNTTIRLLIYRELLVSLFFLLATGCFGQTTATLTGIVTSNLGGLPVIGATITVGNQSTCSVTGGIYSLTINPAGTYPVACTKPGYENFLSAPITFAPGTSNTLPIVLSESLNPPALVDAVLDSTVPSPAVNISWQVPRGAYEILYDDGIMDNFTVWAVQGNMNAVKFTPAGYPAMVTGGKVNIGTAANYPPGSIAFVPFQVSVYDATGPGGTPGTKIGGPVDVIPAGFGWIDFTFSAPTQINGGSFYLVMIQGGNAPNATGLAVDETSPQFRSYSRFVTSGNYPWVPASGNFLIRALVNGPGGPMMFAGAPAGVTGYTVSRLRQGEEQNPAIWTLVGSGTATTMTDNNWTALPCGPYRWAVRAEYTGNRTSPDAFSNVIGKCWIVNTTVHVNLTCDSAPRTGITVRLSNLVYPDTLYEKPADTSGTAIFTDFWKGSYQLKVSRFGYQDFIQNVSISTDTTLTVFLLQNKTAPSALMVNDSNLIAHWNKPISSVELFRETWQSGSFTTNSWTVQGPNWGISSAVGKPNPSAMFSWSPPATNYEQSIVSKPIAGQSSPILRLHYDIFLDNYGTTSMNQLAVELWDGSAWHLLRNYNNSIGNIPWTTQDLDISAYSGTTFNIRFRAYGQDSYDINNWNIDNIVVTATESSAIAGDCILGYNLFLDNILLGFTPDTFYPIPPSMVQYGNSYTACVAAIYGSGSSGQDCHVFMSRYLVPPGNLKGTAIDDAAYLTWDKPVLMMNDQSSSSTAAPGLSGYIIYRDGAFIDSVKNTDSTFYNDLGLYPGSYSYKVTSLYDLAYYGYPGQSAQSYPAGPVAVEINYGLHLPFSEPWDMASFEYQGWSFLPDTGNWSVSLSLGNPPPSAQFSWSPPGTNYSWSLVSPILNASMLGCSNIWLNFDYRLLDHNSTGNEKLSAELFYNNDWHPVAEISNQGTTGWLTRQLDITPVKGKAFRVRFRANGNNTEDIITWNVDNVYIYGVCKPPERLVADTSGLDVRLTWLPPVCEDGNPLNEGFEEPGFPPSGWTQTVTNSNDVTWKHVTSVIPPGVHSGAYAAGLTWDYAHQDEWLIAKNIEITGDLTFWSYAFQGSVHLDHYYVKLSEDQGNHWQLLLDMSALSPYPSSSGYNEWEIPYTIDLSAHVGQVVDLAWQAVDGDGQGLWYAWLIDDCSVASKKILPLKYAAPPAAYNVYRQDAGNGSYNLINSTPVQDTTYLDQGLQPTIYRYYVTAYNPDCSFATSSDTALINVVAGISSSDPRNLSIFPNPANSVVTIQSLKEILSVVVFNYLGQEQVRLTGNGKREQLVNVAGFPQGVYVVKVTTRSGVNSVRIAVSR